jgi:DNA modification methylase
MINGCVEDIIDNFKRKFDLILTSPPYYNLEIYSNDKKQSINKYKSFDLWYENFLLKSINSSINKLDDNGIVAININNFTPLEI